VTSLFFVVPAAGRVALAEVCLRQLRRTCETLAETGVQASAVVIADDESLDVARSLGFGTVERNNDFLGRKVNDGLEAAGLAGVDFAVTCGSDNWIDPAWVSALLPGADEIRCSRLMSMVSEDGRRLAPLRITGVGGHGVRVFPRQLLERVGFRPAEESARRWIDFSILKGLGRSHRLVYLDDVPLCIVDWKSSTQLHSYGDRLRDLDGVESSDPFGDLAAVFPAEALDEMRCVYGIREQVAA